MDSPHSKRSKCMCDFFKDPISRRDTACQSWADCFLETFRKNSQDDESGNTKENSIFMKMTPDLGTILISLLFNPVAARQRAMALLAKGLTICRL